MTKSEYAEYKEAVSDFFSWEGIENLTSGHARCLDCEVIFEAGACPQCGKDSGAFPNEPFFSWRPCECCRRSEGGDRVVASGYNRELDEIAEYNVCEDCAYYAEYGQLDDSTMWDIEHGPDS